MNWTWREQLVLARFVTRDAQVQECRVYRSCSRSLFGDSSEARTKAEDFPTISDNFRRSGGRKPDRQAVGNHPPPSLLLLSWSFRTLVRKSCIATCETSPDGTLLSKQCGTRTTALSVVQVDSVFFLSSAPLVCQSQFHLHLMGLHRFWMNHEFGGARHSAICHFLASSSYTNIYIFHSGGRQAMFELSVFRAASWNEFRR